MEETVRPQSRVSLRPITSETVWSIVDLKVTPDQERFVASNTDSLLEALFAPEAWFRAIYADETPVGFMMVGENSNAYGPVNSPTGEFYLWRLMIAAEHQGHGYGRAAVEQLTAMYEARPDVIMLILGCGEGEGSPRDFYRRLGFVETGEIVDGEIVMQRPLTKTAT